MSPPRRRWPPRLARASALAWLLAGACTVDEVLTPGRLPGAGGEGGAAGRAGLGGAGTGGAGRRGHGRRAPPALDAALKEARPQGQKRNTAAPSALLSSRCTPPATSRPSGCRLSESSGKVPATVRWPTPPVPKPASNPPFAS